MISISVGSQAGAVGIPTHAICKRSSSVIVSLDTKLKEMSFQKLWDHSNWGVLVYKGLSSLTVENFKLVKQMKQTWKQKKSKLIKYERVEWRWKLLTRAYSPVSKIRKSKTWNTHWGIKAKQLKSIIYLKWAVPAFLSQFSILNSHLTPVFIDVVQALVIRRMPNGQILKFEAKDFQMNEWIRYFV